MESAPFRFKKFEVCQKGVVHAVGTDGVLLGAWVDIQVAQNVLDIGTGTGIVALMLAQRINPPTQITGIEIHPTTYLQTLENFKNSPWTNHLLAKNISLQDFAQVIDSQFDTIVSNPPFFGESVVSPDEVRRLGRSTNSLSPQDLITCVKKLLKPLGKFSMILPEKEGRQFCELATCQGLYFNRITEIYAKKGKPIERLLIEFSRTAAIFQKSTLTILNEENEFSDEYRTMAKDFYLNF
jgi:tRNA1Val (adenine37-N6)-methyltransferase